MPSGDLPVGANGKRNGEMSAGYIMGLKLPQLMLRMICPLLAALLGACRPCADVHLKVLSVENRGSYECRTAAILTSAGDSIPVCLLVPELTPGKKYPAVLMLHDHGARFDIGKEKLACPSDGCPDYIRRSSEEWTRRYFDGAYMADSLASQGYVVLVPDALYWGGRSSADARRWSELSFGSGHQDDGARGPECRDSLKVLKERVFNAQKYVHDSLLASSGVEWASKILEDDMTAASVLASLPFVDRSRTGAFGFSMGAHRCWLLSAFSDDIRFGASVCWMLMKEDYDATSVSDLSMRISGLRDSLDFPDIAGMACPKPMLFISGSEDPLFPEESVRKAFRRITGIYSSHGVPDKAVTAFSDEGHHCGRDVQDSVYAFFSRCISAAE